MDEELTALKALQAFMVESTATQRQFLCAMESMGELILKQHEQIKSMQQQLNSLHLRARPRIQ